jgi:halocyanin-like protein
VGALASPAAAQPEEPDYGGWFDDVSNYDGTVDKRGTDRVEVTVGADGNNGNFAFGPPAIYVSPGTTVVWKWNGKGGVHNVVAEDGSYQSGDPVSEAGTTYERTFETTGISKYYCTPHKGLGMKGAVVVREGGGESESETPAGPPKNPDFDGYLDGVSNFEGTTVDRTGQEQTTLTVGASGNNGNFAFDPAAVRVSPGTTVVWEWNGKGGSHNVVAEDGSFDSGAPVVDEGTTFEQTFEEPGIYPYFCNPHKGLGMKGAIVVGDLPGDDGGEESRGPAVTPGIGIGGASILLAFFSPLAFALAMHKRYRHRGPPRTGEAQRDGPLVAEEAPTKEPANALEHDEFDPWGTAALVAFYFVLIGVLWLFMYFVEFLGRVTVIG